MNIIVDFSGFYIYSHYAITELAIARLSRNSIKIDYEILINEKELPYSIEDFNCLEEFEDFQSFINKTNIDWNKAANSYHYNDLIEKFKSFKNHNIFVRNKTNAEILAYELNYAYPIIPLSRFGFDINQEVMTTNCANHQSPDSYCAKDNAKNMAKWLKENFIKKLPTIENNFAAVDLCPEKSLRVFCFNNEGTVIAKKLITFVFPTSVESNESTLDNYRRNYQEKFGVEYNHKNLTTSFIKSQLMKILLKNKIEFIFVLVPNRKEFLLKLFGPLFTIIVAEDNDFQVETYGFNTQDDPSDEMLQYCLEYHDKDLFRMVNWVLRTKIYLTVRQESKSIDSDD